MSPPPPSKGKATPAYINSARGLTDAARANRVNTGFAEIDQGDVIYILDANVAVHYLQAGSAAQGQLSFGSLLRNDEASRTIAQISDRMTVEFLLSGSLPGQGERPVYLAPPHWNEVLNKAHEVANGLGQLEGRHKESLGRLQAISDPTSRIARAETLLPRWIADAIKTAQALERRLGKAFSGSNPKLRALDTDPNLWPRALESVRAADIRDWRRAILEAKSANKPRANGGKTRDAVDRSSRNLEHDVEVLATIQALYRENPEACGDDRTLKLLLITADRSILSAVTRREQELAEEGIPLFVQHPRTFSPILNLSAMTTITTPDPAIREELRSIFVEVETALTRLFGEEEDQKTVLGGRLGPWTIDGSALREARRNWSEVAKHLVTVHARLFSEDSDAVAEAARLLDDVDALQQLTERLRSNIQNIGDKHGQAGTVASIERLSIIVNQKRATGAAEQRAPLQVIGVDVLASVRQALRSEFPGGADTLDELYRLLDAVAQRPGGNDLATKVARALAGDRARDTYAQLLAACIYLSVGAWHSGRECARRVRDATVVKSVLRREANYCVALANRFLLRSQRDFREASDRLAENLEDATKEKSAESQLAGMRDKTELAALRMTVCLLQAIDDAMPFKRVIRDLGPDARLVNANELPDMFGRALDRMHDARNQYDDEFSGVTLSSGLQKFLERLRIQLFTNLAGAHIFRHTLGALRSIAPPSREELREALARLNEEFPVATASRMTRVYAAVGKALLDPNEGAREYAIRLITEELSRKHLSEVDRCEFDYLCSCLYGLETNGGNAADLPPRPPETDTAKEHINVG